MSANRFAGHAYDGDARTLPDDGADAMPRAEELRELFGIRFWDVDLERIARFIVRHAVCDDSFDGYFVNAHCINVAARDDDYARQLAGAPFVFADGVGMAIAARMHGLRFDHNANGTDLFPYICRAAAAASLPIALLGSRPGVAHDCARRMQARIPGLQVAWIEHGYLGACDEAVRVAELNRSGARILFVAKGVPMQEHWMAAHRPRIDVPVMLGVGALFDFYSGTVPRAPPLVRRLQAEWLYRLLREPRRLARRYLLGNPEFIARTVSWRTSGHRLGSGRGAGP